MAAVRGRRAAVALLGAAVWVGCRGEARPVGAVAYADKVAADVPQIEKALGVPFKRPPKLEVRTRAQVRQFVLAQLDDSTSRHELAGKEATYKVLGLIPDTMNTRQLFVDLYSEQILGYYDPKSKVLYVAQGAPDEYVGITIMHELVHALQDQYVNLDSLLRQTGDDDRQMAAQAVIEGEATYEQLRVMVGGKNNIAANLPGGWDRMREMIRDDRSQPVFTAAPMAIREELLFPYINGADFVRRYKDHGAPGLPFQAMPQSTEQVMHDRAYFGAARDEPVHVTLPATPNEIYQNTLGEFDTRLFLFAHLRDQEAASRAAIGWGGDRYAVVRTAHGNALTWVTVWDSALDAAEFVDVLGQAVERRYRITAPTIGRDGVRTFAAQARTVVVTPTEISGKNVVLVVDVPSGTSPQLVDLRRVVLSG